ncbi:hypothetical protein FF100_01475 [Methylobacterium terricola]|uniref:DUF2268 domain-containing protein n=1 Tax=Methylobacterium terricola TaxID=2583531 RepID=A0A5C4LQC7_9HYPH|nr:DUF2268 domain-containing putative Zn-dependent protease [Methylobacterium terricola]TNC15964.1 hypothetical protein FF100_01475 [Methylobacterium terricola]
MTVEIVVFNGSGRLPADLEAEIRAGIGEGVSALGQHLELGRIGIAVHVNELMGSEDGFGGLSLAPDSCRISVDPYSDMLPRVARPRAAAVAIHELHHVLRMRQPFWPRAADICAGEAIVLEGLATHCEMFLGQAEPWLVREARNPLTHQYLREITPDVADPRSNWGWIYRRRELPTGTAIYPMGHAVVGAYLSAAGTTPIDAIGVPWQDVWATWSDLSSRSLRG